MTLKLTLPAITDSTGLQLAPPAAHPLKRKGSISLIDPAYPSLPWATGIPGTVPNLAGGEDFGVAVSMANGIVTRTEKGAFLAVASTAATGNDTVTFTSAAARTKLLDAIGAGHEIAIAEVYQIAREAASSVTQSVSYRWAGLITTGGTNDVATLRVTSANTVVGYPRDRVTQEQAGTVLISTGAQAAASVVRGLGTAGTSTALHVHHNGGAGSKQASRITYLAVIEDLTASGISAADFIASINAWKNTNLTGAGRYANDRWAAIPPR